MLELENARVYLGSNLDVLPTLPDNSVDSIVTDPPYELGFMGKSWDNSGIAYSVELWAECMRVLKPGGHLLAFGGSRTWHRLAVAIEDAGFEMRDSIAWLYGSGFPKSLDVSKAIDKQAGAECEVIKTKIASPKGISGAESRTDTAAGAYGGEAKEINITVPATLDAIKWQGWGTALKPAFEPIIVARKPLIGTVATNVLEWGTGGLNIDVSRIGINPGYKYRADANGTTFHGEQGQRIKQTAEAKGSEFIESTQGRWPANIILDEYTAGLLDKQSGFSKSTGVINRFKSGAKPFGGAVGEEYESVQGVADSGGASRFFYVAKANKKDRNEGLEELGSCFAPTMGNGIGSKEHDPQTATPKQNFHPTVKPTTLMEYLIKLVTPVGGIVLDPFTGSGSTGKAALLNGYQFIGIELTEEYLPIIEGRLKWAINEAKTNLGESLF